MKIITEKMMKIVEINQYEKATRKAVYSMIGAYIEKLNAWGGQHA